MSIENKLTVAEKRELIALTLKLATLAFQHGAAFARDADSTEDLDKQQALAHRAILDFIYGEG